MSKKLKKIIFIGNVNVSQWCYPERKEMVWGSHLNCF